MVSVPCDSCSAPIKVGDDFCEACGAQVSEASKQALRQRLEASDATARQQLKSVREATQAIVVLAVLFVIGGILMFALSLGTANDALENLRGLDDAAVVDIPVDGEIYSAGELRTMIEREPYQILGINLLLACIMAALAYWSRRSALPAVVTALAVFVVVHLLNALVDPTTIAQGVIIKVVATIVLIKGVRAAYDARRIQLGVETTK